VADENWVPPAAGGLRASAGWGFPLGSGGADELEGAFS